MKIFLLLTAVTLEVVVVVQRDVIEDLRGSRSHLATKYIECYRQLLDTMEITRK